MKQAWSNASTKDSSAAEVEKQITQWNRRSEADSEGALAYYAFKKGLGGTLVAKVDPPSDLADEQVLNGLEKAAEWLQQNFGSLRVPYGKYFRVGRAGGERTFPVGGGSVHDAGMATIRAISFAPAGKEVVGRGGQTSTQIVVMTDPPQSYTIVPLGANIPTRYHSRTGVRTPGKTSSRFEGPRRSVRMSRSNSARNSAGETGAVTAATPGSCRRP